jgi:hypothetical protein
MSREARDQNVPAVVLMSERNASGEEGARCQDHSTWNWLPFSRTRLLASLSVVIVDNIVITPIGLLKVGLLVSNVVNFTELFFCSKFIIIRLMIIA